MPVPDPLEPPQSDPLPELNALNVVKPEDAYGATPRWVVLDQEPVSRFVGGDA
jgi:hypothetical protein